MSDDGSVASATNAVVLQDAAPGGGWVTRSSPEVVAGPLGMRSLVRDGRVIFPAGTSLETITLSPVSYTCEGASHSRLGDVAESLAEEMAPEFAEGDTLTLDFAASEAEGEGEDCFFRVAIPGEATSTAARRQAPSSPRTPEVAKIPTAFALHAARPNPFAQLTTIRFDLPRAVEVKFEVFDVQGRRVATLVNGPREAGRHVANWDGRMDSGTRASGGVYLCRMTAGEFHAERRISLVR